MGIDIYTIIKIDGNRIQGMYSYEYEYTEAMKALAELAGRTYSEEDCEEEYTVTENGRTITYELIESRRMM